MPRKIGASTFSENFQGSDYSAEEWAFIQAIAAYQTRWNRRYPCWREILHVLKCLGYRKVAGAVPIDPDPTASEAKLVHAAKNPPAAEPPAA